jgi:hypothetical protein
LNFGLGKINLNEKQREKLINLAFNQFKTFALSEEQKTILTSLAPLTKEEKFSENSLELLNSLKVKQSALKFFISEQIFPDPHTDFGKPTNPYLPLKNKFLLGEQKTLQLVEKEKQKELSQTRIRKNKLAIIQSLLLFGKSNKITVSYSEIIKGANKDEKLAQLTYSLAD